MTYNELFDKFIDNKNRAVELDSLLLDPSNKEAWLTNFKRRVSELEVIYKDNQKILDEADYLNSLPIQSEEEALELYDIAFKYYCKFYDTQILAPLFKRLIRYYESIDNPDNDRLLGAYYIYSACINELDIRNNREKLFVDYYKKVVTYKDIFLELNRLGKNSIICAYHSLISVSIETKAIPFHENVKYLMEFFNFITNKEIEEDTIKNGLNEKVDIFLEKSLSIFQIIDKLDDDDINELIKFITYMENKPNVSKQLLLEARLHLDAKIGKISYVSAASRIMDSYQEIAEKYKLSDIDNKTTTAEDWENALWLEYMNTPVGYDEFVKRIDDIPLRNKLFFEMDKIVRENWKEPKCPDFVHVYPQFISIWVNTKLRYIDNIADLRKCLLNGILKKQIPTFIHSIMVKNIALAIYDEMEELFVDLPVDNIREYIYDAAIFHDIGKISIANIINTQDRRLTASEFRGIRNHPQLGLDIIENTTLLDPIKDVILYHHKHYDGKRGYPDNVSNLDSKYKLAVDLITIADCLDTATDFFGRSYKKAKRASEVFGEFEAGMGTRYNPEIIKRILASSSLKQKLDSITGSQREDLMYEAYKNGIENM